MKGWKTWTATIGYAVLGALAALMPQYAEPLMWVANTLLVPLGVVGLAHKVEKIS